MEIERAQRYLHQISLICLDLDHFKQVNDTYSHAAGDAVLRKIGHILQTELREVDFAARIGGEEFAIMLPETDMHEATTTAERLRNIIAISNVEYEGLNISMTASFGVVCTNIGISLDHLLSLADKALYQAKDNGRNCVVVSRSNHEDKNKLS